MNLNRNVLAFMVLVTLASQSAAERLRLPSEAPIPQLNPADPAASEDAAPDNVPVPQARPDPLSPAAGADTGSPPASGEADTPAVAPIPTDAPEEQKAGDKTPEGKPPAAPADPRSTEVRADTMPPEEVACRERLQKLGVAFADRPAEKDASGCSMPYPMSVKTLGNGVAIEPEALMNCAMTEAAARFVAETVAPTAKRDFGADLKSIAQASAYVCRPRNGTTKLSEHAFGNALDIASFKLSDDTVVDVVLRPEEAAARFLGTLRKAACGPFKTVLGPGSNADHATHFHLDLAPRRHGGTVCE